VLNLLSTGLVYVCFYHSKGSHDHGGDNDNPVDVPLMEIETSDAAATTSLSDLPSVPVVVSTITIDSYEKYPPSSPSSDFMAMKESHSTVSHSTAHIETPLSYQQQDQTIKTTTNRPTPHPLPSSDTDQNEDDDDEEEEQEEEENATFSFFGGFHLSYSCFFLWVLPLSTIVFIRSLASLVVILFDGEDRNGTTLDWQHWLQYQRLGVVFAMTYGMYIAACGLGYLSSRSFAALTKYVPSLLQFSKDKIPPNIYQTERFRRITFMAVSLFGFAMSILVCVQGLYFHTSSQQKQQVQQWTHLQSLPFYIGEAWTKDGGATILGENVTCDTNDHLAIPVSVTVIWGGQWACPSNSGVYCEATIESKVSCEYWKSFAFDEYEDDMMAMDDVNAMEKVRDDVTLDDYIYFRYHDYDIEDGEASYDFANQVPSSHALYWNRPTETILGSCDGTCIAQSFTVFRTNQAKVYMHHHWGFLGLGMSLVFFVGCIQGAVAWNHG
jgi:hypothetical protein